MYSEGTMEIYGEGTWHLEFVMIMICRQEAGTEYFHV